MTLTATMMVVEILYRLAVQLNGVADGWHMSTHAAALGITALAYVLARRYASDTQVSFGTWKIEALGGFASSILLVLVALYMVAESIRRFFRPLDIHYDQVLMVAIVGLSIWSVLAQRV
ncbi:MAG: cation transporter [Anaerolineae bacterium]